MQDLRISRALLSVSNKEGLVELGRALARYGVELISTGGTARTLRDAGLEVKDHDGRWIAINPYTLSSQADSMLCDRYVAVRVSRSPAARKKIVVRHGRSDGAPSPCRRSTVLSQSET